MLHSRSNNNRKKKTVKKINQLRKIFNGGEENQSTPLYHNEKIVNTYQI